MEKKLSLFLSGLLIVLSAGARASVVVSVTPLTDQILLVHLDDGWVIHHQRGQPRTMEQVIVNPLDVRAASDPARYRVGSAEDARYRSPLAPVGVGRKSKGTDFAWFADSWVNGRAVNNRPDHAKEHWLYLFLPAPLREGATYTLSVRDLAYNGREWSVKFESGRSRSEAVHVNLLGYVPSAPRKIGYVYQWMGDRGSLDLKGYAGRPFRILDLVSRKPVFGGRLAFRAPANQQETFHKADSPPDGSFLKADVYECDFSAFGKPGRYLLSVEGIGCSFPFRIHADVYREAFRTVARGLYHNRSGIALERQYTEFPRPAPHNPKVTPGFAGKLLYTSLRFSEWGSEGGDAKELMRHAKGPIETAGWYQDAGDWDSYYTHLRPAQELLLVYEMAPRNFRDGELNVPESGNGVPDILDEAAWLPRFLYRLRHELLHKRYGTGGVGLRIAGDAFGSDEGTVPDGTKVGRGSWEDTDRTYVASGEDPWSTYRYAGAAAHLAVCLEIAKTRDPEGVNWAQEAREAYGWAASNTRPGDDSKENGNLTPQRLYAAAALFRLTGDRQYEEQVACDTASLTETTVLQDDRRYGPMLYALPGGKASPDSALLKRIRGAVLHTADQVAVETAAKRALRWGGNWYMPMLVGQQTTPWVMEGAVGYTITRHTDPGRARAYLASLYTTCDYFLGTNALNMTWVTGLGPRNPRHVFHMDAWYNGKDRFHPGIIPYGPWRKEKELGQGPWDVAWPHSTVYPAIDEWPGNERWFDNRCSPMNSEFTIHQNTGPAAAIFGFLCAPTSSLSQK